LTKFGRRIERIDPAANDAGGGQDRAVLPADPTMAHADRRAVFELHLAARRAWQSAGHGQVKAPCWLTRDGIVTVEMTVARGPFGTLHAHSI
jgi:hypothetical protein